MTDGIYYKGGNMTPIFTDGWVLSVFTSIPDWIAAICAVVAIIYAKDPVTKYYYEIELFKTEQQLTKIERQMGMIHPVSTSSYVGFVADLEGSDYNSSEYKLLWNRKLNLKGKLRKLGG